MEIKNNNQSDKINVLDLIKDFTISTEENFTPYLKEVYKDLCQRSEEKTKGISKITFIKYFDLPGIISERLFAVFDNNKNEYINFNEFSQGMTSLYSGTFEQLIKLIFDFYDFNKDGKISREDVRVVLSYIPLKIVEKTIEKKGMKLFGGDINDRIESQDELHQILQKCFKDDKEQITLEKFFKIIEDIHSEIFLFILIFLLEKKPFSKKTLREYKSSQNSPKKIVISSPSPTKDSRDGPERSEKKSNTVGVTNSGLLGNNLISNIRNSPTILIKSPKQNSKFAPADKITNSPTVVKQGIYNKANSKELNELSSFSLNGNSPFKSPVTNLEKRSSEVETLSLNGSGSGNNSNKTSPAKNVPVRKNRNVLTNIDDVNKKNLFTNHPNKEYKDIVITKAVKRESGKGISGISSTELENVKNVLKEEFGNNEDTTEDTDEDHIEVFEGYLYKITETKKMKKIYFKLIGKDIYYYKSKEDPEHKGMHNLTGIFVQREPEEVIDNQKMFCFSIIYPKKKRIYLSDNESEIKTWISKIQKAMGYTDITEIYDVKEKLGNGKFGLVKLGIHKETGQKVAIKIMSKKDMSSMDMELVKTEIEILKVCQHPNIIRIYDIFENLDLIYISGDFFVYMQKRGFKLPETRAAHIIHKMSAAVFYLHSYGIAHRDLKPENILMTDNTDDADIRLLDFGLSKIIGPGETCTEPYGTLSYVAPEVLLEKPYDKSVDLWTIGIITFMILTATLPFDDPNSEREIARQTINEPVYYNPKIWSKLSDEAKNFVDKLLQKDPKKRMTIKEVLEHSWIQKFTKTGLTEKRRGSRDMSGSFQIYTSTTEDRK